MTIKQHYKRLTTIFLTFFVIHFLILPSLRAQTETVRNPKNTLYLVAGYAGLYGAFGINYERQVAHRPNSLFKSYWIRTSVGEWGGWTSGGPFQLLSLHALTGKRNSHIEVGAGILRYVDDEEGDYDIEIYPAGTVGYRLQPADGGFIFRVGASFPESFYLGFGWAF